jgi:signal peptidase II
MLVLILGLVVVWLDQWTKLQVRTSFVYGGDAHPVIPGFFNLVYVRNEGAAWGLFGGQMLLLVLVSLAVLVLLAIYHRKLLNPTWDHRIALGLMVGGICGNLIDRVRLGWVTDFLDFHIGSWHWPSFNVADSAICIAAGIYLISSFWHTRHPLKTSAHEG